MRVRETKKISEWELSAVGPGHAMDDNRGIGPENRYELNVYI